MSQVNEKVMQEGAEAFKAGRTFKDNPYNTAGDAHDWATGFVNAEIEDARKFRWSGTTGGAGHGRCDKYINPLTSK